MSIRKIINIPDAILRKVSKPVEQINEPLLKVLDDMAETMYDAPGIGLAGIQIALPLRVLVVDCEQRASDEEGDGEAEEGEAPAPKSELKEIIKNPIFLINPEIVSFSDEPSFYEEGCLSIPEYYAEVERPASCVVKYLDRDGKSQEMEVTGLLSTCIQHELDHLDGKLFIDHISRLKRDMIVKKFTKIAKTSGTTPAQPLVL